MIAKLFSDLSGNIIAQIWAGQMVDLIPQFVFQLIALFQGLPSFVAA